MDFQLLPLPYPQHALEPHLGRETLHYHYDKHHAGYLAKLRELVGSTAVALHTLEEIVLLSDDDVFENAAQVWNHDFYWRSMRPGGGGEPPEPLRGAIERAFGGIDAFHERFVERGTQLFGSGWVWLVAGRDRLRIETTADADLPLTQDRVPLLCADVWEHAYYLDYRNDRRRYLATFLEHLVDWESAASRWKTVGADEPMAVRMERLRTGESR